MRSLYLMLQKIKYRPGIYLGEKSIVGLKSYLTGLIDAENEINNYIGFNEKFDDFVLSGTIGYFLSRYISNEASVQIQNVFFTIVFALGSSMMMFVIGMIHVAILYYIKKYAIMGREISNTDGVPSIPPSLQ